MGGFLCSVSCSGGLAVVIVGGKEVGMLVGIGGNFLKVYCVGFWALFGARSADSALASFVQLRFLSLRAGSCWEVESSHVSMENKGCLLVAFILSWLSDSCVAQVDLLPELIACSSVWAWGSVVICVACCLLLPVGGAGLRGGRSTGCRVTLPVVSLIEWLFFVAGADGFEGLGCWADALSLLFSMFSVCMVFCCLVTSEKVVLALMNRFLTSRFASGYGMRSLHCMASDSCSSL